MSEAATVTLPKETYDLLISIIKGDSHACQNPDEIDYHDYVACGKCRNCEARQKLKASGLKEFEGYWS